jgi:hypothetical protein
MNDNRIPYRPTFLPLAGALTFLALGCTQPTSSDVKEIASTQSAVENLVAPPPPNVQPIACQTEGPAIPDRTRKAGADLARESVAETDVMYRAPSTPKPEPDLAAMQAAGAKLAARPVDPKVFERQAEYVAALPALEAKHPQRGDDFERERMALKERILNGESK